MSIAVQTDVAREQQNVFIETLPTVHSLLDPVIAEEQRAEVGSALLLLNTNNETTDKIQADALQAPLPLVACAKPPPKGIQQADLLTISALASIAHMYLPLSDPLKYAGQYSEWARKAIAIIYSKYGVAAEIVGDVYVEALASHPLLKDQGDFRTNIPHADTVKRAAMELSFYQDCAIAETLSDSVEIGLGADATCTWYDRNLLAIALWGRMIDGQTWEGPSAIVELTQPGAKGVFDAICHHLHKLNGFQNSLGKLTTQIHDIRQMSLDNEAKNMGLRAGLQALCETARFKSWYQNEYKPHVRGIIC